MPGIPNSTAVQRALSVLEQLDSSRRGLNICEISRQLGIPQSSARVIVVTLERLGYVQRKHVGRRMDLHCTGVGKVILAFGAEEAVERTLAKQVYIRHTRNTITSSRALRRELARVRQLGYAVDNEEEELAVRCVAVPVFHPNGRFAAALFVVGTTQQAPLHGIKTLAQGLGRSTAAIFPAVSMEQQ